MNHFPLPLPWPTPPSRSSSGVSRPIPLSISLAPLLSASPSPALYALAPPIQTHFDKGPSRSMAQLYTKSTSVHACWLDCSPHCALLRMGNGASPTGPFTSSHVGTHPQPTVRTDARGHVRKTGTSDVQEQSIRGQ
ncbi:unnamed protein product [Protopolystoma xenopodis]|uniref:Uncharacterized protein n=1 Tax=Protopolystoma xenopodis TaxID=117903 RepID=A0A3S5FDS5_9PLAT|nr:unnamed protein product [Protopolystoma xenopodis]